LGCSDTGDDAAEADPSVSAATAATPTEGELLTSLLTPADVGPEFGGPPPAVAGTEAAEAGVSDEPLCGVDDDLDELAQVSVGPMTDPDATQVYERLTVADGITEAEDFLTTVRERADARCRFDETVEATTYTVTVRGAVELDGVGDDAVAIDQAYTGGYTGFRWDMTARRGRLLVNVQYTSTDPVERDRAVELLQLAVDKASVLS
ncbi:MAG: hypothetical protein ACLGIG_10995, partial [Actinomycetes bacterium]